MDDLYFFNFMDLGKGVIEKCVERIIYKFNFFVDFIVVEVNEIVVGLMLSDGGLGLGMWEGCVLVGMEVINKVLYWFKDYGYFDIDFDIYCNYFVFDEFVVLVMNDDILKFYCVVLYLILILINYKVFIDQDKNLK